MGDFLSDEDLTSVERLFKLMLANKVFVFKRGDFQIELSQYAHAPAAKQLEIPAFIPPPKQEDVEQPPEWRAASDFFKQELERAAPSPSAVPIPQAVKDSPAYQERPTDPTDPNGPINDGELFGSNLPQPS